MRGCLSPHLLAFLFITLVWCIQEYGNPFSTMGNGNWNDFLVEGKIAFGWIGEEHIVDVTAYSDVGIGNCDPTDCGPFKLAPSDVATKADGSSLAIRIKTATKGRHFYIEHRTTESHASSERPASSSSYALLTWTLTEWESNGIPAYGQTVWDSL